MPFNLQDIATGVVLSAILWSANRVRKLFADVDIAFTKIRALEKERNK